MCSVLDYWLSLFYHELSHTRRNIVRYNSPVGIMMLISSSPASTFHSHDWTPNIHLSSSLKMSPLLLSEAIFLCGFEAFKATEEDSAEPVEVKPGSFINRE